MDEWLHKWNRTCPLCKSTIKRKGARVQQPPAQTDDNETSLLLPQDHTSVAAAVAEDQPDGATPGNQYGATGVTTVVFHSTKSSRGASACSSSSGDEITGNRDQVTSAEIELSVGSPGEVGGRLSTSLYHTPLHSDDEDNTPSYATAYSDHTSTDSELTPQKV